MCCGTVDPTILFKRTNAMNTGLASLFIITVATETLVVVWMDHFNNNYTVSLLQKGQVTAEAQCSQR
jgi:hypothetical protein